MGSVFLLRGRANNDWAFVVRWWPEVELSYGFVADRVDTSMGPFEEVLTLHAFSPYPTGRAPGTAPSGRACSPEAPINQARAFTRPLEIQI